MPNVSSWSVRVAIVMSLLWLCLVYVFAAQRGQLTATMFVQWCAAPLLLAWGTGWVISALRAQHRIDCAEPLTAPSPPAEAGISNASATARFLARMFDMTIWSFVLGYPLGYVLGLCSQAIATTDAATPFVMALTMATVFLLLSLPLNLWFDALVFRWFGNTPGKALLGLSVHTRADERLSPAQYMNRNFAMWAPGFGCGIPLLSIVTLCLSGQRLKRTGSTRWDAKYEYQVVQTRKRAWRVSLFILIALLMAALSRMDGQETAKSVGRLFIAETKGSMRKTAQPNSNLARATWRNPMSGLPVLLDASWHEEPSLENGLYEYVFVTFGGDQIIGVRRTFERKANSVISKPISSLQERVENGRRVFEGEGLGAPGQESLSDTAALYSYVDARGLSQIRPYMRFWAFQGSGTYWDVLYAAEASVQLSEQNSRNFLAAFLNSTNGDQLSSEAKWGENNEPIEWLNPVSGRTVRLDAKWHYNPFMVDKTNPWTFDSADCRSGQCIGGEESVGIRYFPNAGTSQETLQACAQALHTAGDSIYPLLTNAREMVENDRTVWVGQATSYAYDGLQRGSHLMRFWLFRGNGGFWRVSYAAQTGFPRDDRDAERFFHAVLNTTTP